MIWTPEMLAAAYLAKPRRGANNDCGGFIKQTQNFMSHNRTLFGEWCRRDVVALLSDDLGEGAETRFWYAVFSYGHHFPAAVYLPSAELWVTNLFGKRTLNHIGGCDDLGGVSPTTRRHQSVVASAIRDCPQQPTTLAAIKNLARLGPVGFITARLERAA